MLYEKESRITYNLPNTRKDSENLAKEFISRAASGVLTKMILDKMEKRSENNNSESYSDLD